MPKEQHGQLRMMFLEILPLQTFTATALCQICHMNPASFLPRSFVHIEDYLKQKLAGRTLAHIFLTSSKEEGTACKEFPSLASCYSEENPWTVEAPVLAAMRSALDPSQAP
jgi:hypothetical protein